MAVTVVNVIPATLSNETQRSLVQGGRLVYPVCVLVVALSQRRVIEHACYAWRGAKRMSCVGSNLCRLTLIRSGAKKISLLAPN